LHVVSVETAQECFQLKEKMLQLFCKLYWLGMWWCWRIVFCCICRKKTFQGLYVKLEFFLFSTKSAGGTCKQTLSSN